METLSSILNNRIKLKFSAKSNKATALLGQRVSFSLLLCLDGAFPIKWCWHRLLLCLDGAFPIKWCWHRLLLCLDGAFPIKWCWHRLLLCLDGAFPIKWCWHRLLLCLDGAFPIKWCWHRLLLCLDGAFPIKWCWHRLLLCLDGAFPIKWCWHRLLLCLDGAFPIKWCWHRLLLCLDGAFPIKWCWHRLLLCLDGAFPIKWCWHRLLLCLDGAFPIKWCWHRLLLCLDGAFPIKWCWHRLSKESTTIGMSSSRGVCGDRQQGCSICMMPLLILYTIFKIEVQCNGQVCQVVLNSSSSLIMFTKMEHTVPIFNTTHHFLQVFLVVPMVPSRNGSRVLCCGVFSTHTHHASLKKLQAQQTSVQVCKILKIQSWPVDSFSLSLICLSLWGEAVFGAWYQHNLSCMDTYGGKVIWLIKLLHTLNNFLRKWSTSFGIWIREYAFLLL